MPHSHHFYFLHEKGDIVFDYFPEEPQTRWYPGAPAEIDICSCPSTMTVVEAEAAAWQYMEKYFADQDERRGAAELDRRGDTDPDLDVPF